MNPWRYILTAQAEAAAFASEVLATVAVLLWVAAAPDEPVENES